MIMQSYYCKISVQIVFVNAYFKHCISIELSHKSLFLTAFNFCLLFEMELKTEWEDLEKNTKILISKYFCCCIFYQWNMDPNYAKVQLLKKSPQNGASYILNKIFSEGVPAVII